MPGARAASASRFTIELTGTNGTTQSKTLAGGTTAQFDDLTPGAYDIVVEGTDTNNKVVLGGASSATVVAGKTASTTVELVEGVSDFAGLVEAIAAGGTVNILKNIDVSSGLTISKTVKILPAYQDVTLKNTGSENLFTVGTNGNLTIGGGEHTITLDGNKVAKEIIKMSSGTVTLASNGIISNAASTGVSVNGGTFKMTGGSITGNIGSSGGGVNLYSATFNMTGGSISGNTVTGFGGAVSMSSGTFSMTGGSIDNNSSDNRGGGVSVSGGSFNLSGGSITGNSAENYGDGVYMAQGTFNMSGSAVIASDNDVYLYSGTSVNKITVSGAITAEVKTVATITPNSYTAGTQVLYAGDAFLLADAVSKFAVTPDSDGNKWTIDASGNLKQQ